MHGHEWGDRGQTGMSRVRLSVHCVRHCAIMIGRLAAFDCLVGLLHCMTEYILFSF